jgi:hypothetical protein
MANFPLGMEVTDLTQNNRITNLPTENRRPKNQIPVFFELSDSLNLKIRHQKGIGVVPYVPKPNPDDSSAGYKIISENLKNNEYTLIVQGKNGGKVDLELMTFGQKIDESRGASVIDMPTDNGKVILQIDFPSKEKGFSEKKITIKLADNN